MFYNVFINKSNKLNSPPIIEIDIFLIENNNLKNNQFFFIEIVNLSRLTFEIFFLFTVLADTIVVPPLKMYYNVVHIHTNTFKISFFYKKKLFYPLNDDDKSWENALYNNTGLLSINKPYIWFVRLKI